MYQLTGGCINYEYFNGLFTRKKLQARKKVCIRKACKTVDINAIENIYNEYNALSHELCDNASIYVTKGRLIVFATKDEIDQIYPSICTYYNNIKNIAIHNHVDLLVALDMFLANILNAPHRAESNDDVPFYHGADDLNYAQMFKIYGKNIDRYRDKIMEEFLQEVHSERRI